MPKYFCDYCDTHLTHDSPSVRKTHNGGRKHKDNVRLYYMNWLEEQAQSMISQTTAAFKAQQGLMAPPGAFMAAGIPPPGMMPPPLRPGMPPPMIPGMRPPGAILPPTSGVPPFPAAMLQPPMGVAAGTGGLQQQPTAAATEGVAATQTTTAAPPGVSTSSST